VASLAFESFEGNTDLSWYIHEGQPPVRPVMVLDMRFEAHPPPKRQSCPPSDGELPVESSAMCPCRFFLRFGGTFFLRVVYFQAIVASTMNLCHSASNHRGMEPAAVLVTAVEL
jgi:hypothetical protein